jgi:hypothetical protein
MNKTRKKLIGHFIIYKCIKIHESFCFFIVSSSLNKIFLERNFIFLVPHKIRIFILLAITNALSVF